MLSPSPSVPDRFTIPFAWVLPLLSLRSGATLFLPLPAVPDVPFCLSSATSVAIRPVLTVSTGHPNPEALRLGGVMLSPTLLANTASSAGLTHSSRFPFVGYTGDLWHSRVVRACRSDPPLFTPPISHRLPPSIRRKVDQVLSPIPSLIPLATTKSLLAWLFHLLPLQSASRGGVLRRCNVRFMLRPPVLLSSPADLDLPFYFIEKAQRAFYFRAFLGLVTSS